MQHITKISDLAHQELALMLPWYVNKTLQGAELKAIESHLTVCLSCKREVVQLQKLAQAVIQEGSLDSAEQASFSRLKKRLHSGQPLDLQALPQQVRPEQQKTPVSGNVSQLSNARKQRWASVSPALAMAAAVLLTLTVLMPRHVENDIQGSDFRTLSSDAQPEAMNANEIRVVFAENVDQQQKSKILARVQGQFMSDNPTAQGVYTVRLERNIASKHLLDMVEVLRKDSSVIFAEPAYALLSSTHSEKE
jgi:hypothetical protein